MIVIHGVDLIPNTVNVGQYFLIRADVEYVEEIYTWGTLLLMTWGEVATKTWGELAKYRNPDFRNRAKWSGTSNSGQDFVF